MWNIEDVKTNHISSLVVWVYQLQGKLRNALYYFVVKEVKCWECVSFQVPIQIFVENIKDREAERRRGGIWNCFQTSINTYKPETNNLQSQVRLWLHRTYRTLPLVCAQTLVTDQGYELLCCVVLLLMTNILFLLFPLLISNTWTVALLVNTSQNSRKTENIPYGQLSAKLPFILSPSHLVIW